VDTIAQGNAAEAAVLHALAGARIHVLVPFGDGLAFDLAAVAPHDGTVLRIQVKSGRVRKGAVRFNACSSDHGNGRQHYRGRADFIAIHVQSLEQVFMVPVDDCPSFAGFLRLDAPRNNQRKGVRFAADYLFESWVASVRATAAA
jgi:hypothetical protein